LEKQRKKKDGKQTNKISRNNNNSKKQKHKQTKKPNKEKNPVSRFLVTPLRRYPLRVLLTTEYKQSNLGELFHLRN